MENNNMLLKSETIILGEYEFQIQPFFAMKALKLEKKTITLITPVLSALLSSSSDNIKLDSLMDTNIDLEKVGLALSRALENLSDNEFESFVLDMLSSTYFKDGSGKPQIINKEIFNTIFIGNLMYVYRLIIEVMKVNKFSFLALMEDGKGILGIDS